jgi:SAM-dependent methyltransferase
MTEQPSARIGPLSDRDRAYHQLGARFERVMNRYDLERRLELVVARLPQGSPLRAVEIGCGLGYLTAEIRRRRGITPVAMDIARSLLGIAREQRGVDRVVCGDALSLPFRSRSVDLVVSTECIEHTPDPEAAVREILRVMRPGALLVLTCPNARWHWSVRLANRLGMRPYEGHENWPGFAELRGWIEREGGEVIEHLGFHALPFQLPLAPLWLPALDRIALRRFPSMGINQLIVAQAAP